MKNGPMAQMVGGFSMFGTTILTGGSALTLAACGNGIGGNGGPRLDERR